MLALDCCLSCQLCRATLKVYHRRQMGPFACACDPSSTCRPLWSKYRTVRQAGRFSHYSNSHLTGKLLPDRGFTRGQEFCVFSFSTLHGPATN